MDSVSKDGPGLVSHRQRVRSLRERWSTSDACWLGIFCWVFLVPPGCAAPPRAPRAEGLRPQPRPAPRKSAWPGETRSPRPRAGAAGRFAGPLTLCDSGDAALDGVAESAARELVRGKLDLDPGLLASRLRMKGSPYVWPRLFCLSGPPQSSEEIQERVGAFLESFSDGGTRRCGFAALPDGRGGEAVVAVAADVLADLSPVPTRVRLGQWVTIEAQLRTAALNAKVVVLGPRGAPRLLPTSFQAGRARATFSADQPGSWLVQVLADVSGGPRPVAEAMLFAGVEPPDEPLATPAPGEAEVDGSAPPVVALEELIRQARRAEGLDPLTRDADLDRLAESHAQQMMRAGRLAHDVGDGDPKSRAEASGLLLRALGENVAHAADARRAHRAIWSSPAHRATLLDPHFDSVGIGVAVDGADQIWACELFADRTEGP